MARLRTIRGRKLPQPVPVDIHGIHGRSWLPRGVKWCEQLIRNSNPESSSPRVRWRDYLQDARRFAGKKQWKTSQDKAWFPPKASLTSMKSIPGSSEPQSLRFSPIVAGDFCKERVELHRPSYLQQKGMDGHTEDLNLGAPWRTSCQPFLAMDTSFISCITWNWHYIHLSSIFTIEWWNQDFHAKNYPQVNTGKHFGGPSSGSDHKSWSVLNCQRASGMNNGLDVASQEFFGNLLRSDAIRNYQQWPERWLFANVAEKTAGLRCWGQYSQVTTTLEYPRHPSCGSAYCKRIVPGKACSSSLDCLCKHSDNSLFSGLTWAFPGAKWDVLATDADPEKRKTLCRALVA